MIQLLVSPNLNVLLHCLFLQSMVTVLHALSDLSCTCIIESLFCLGFLLSVHDYTSPKYAPYHMFIGFVAVTVLKHCTGSWNYCWLKFRVCGYCARGVLTSTTPDTS